MLKLVFNYCLVVIHCHRIGKCIFFSGFTRGNISLALISSGINPFIYGVMNSTFRTEYKKVLSVVTVKRPVRSSSANISTCLDNPETSLPGSSTKE